MSPKQIRILLADDDADDRLLFNDALNEIDINAALTSVKNGLELMQKLHQIAPVIPDVIFLDINMPLKDGFECLNELKKNEMFKVIPVIIFSTSSEMEFVDKMYEKGAQYYLPKPESFKKLKNVIARVLSFDWQQKTEKPKRDDFILS